MNRGALAALLVASLLIAQALIAQEGHPLKGTWHGSWGVNATDRTPVTLVMDWDGTSVTGIMNPGVRSVPLEKTSLDPATWQFHFNEARRWAQLPDLTPAEREALGASRPRRL